MHNRTPPSPTKLALRHRTKSQPDCWTELGSSSLISRSERKMSTSPTPRPHRRVRSVPIHLNFQITPVTSSRSKATFAPTSGTATPSSAETPNGHPLTRTRRSRHSSGRQSPAHPTSAAYEDHPSLEMKRSTSTFFLSSLPSYRHDWTYRHGARVTAESLEEQGRSWLVTRASSTDLVGQTHHDSDEEEVYHRHDTGSIT